MLSLKTAGNFTAAEAMGVELAIAKPIAKPNTNHRAKTLRRILKLLFSLARK
jgi:hypothetical protein